MPEPIRSDEELQAEVNRKLEDPKLSDEEKLEILSAHEAQMVARHAERAAIQTNYDTHKGRF